MVLLPNGCRPMTQGRWLGAKSGSQRTSRGTLEALSEPYETLEGNIRNQLGRMLGGQGLDPARDIAASAAIELNRKNPKKSLKLLEAASRYQVRDVWEMYAVFVQGLANLRLNRPKNAYSRYPRGFGPLRVLC